MNTSTHATYLHTLDLVDRASLDLSSAEGILYLLEAQFECVDEGPVCTNEQIFSALYATIQLVSSARMTINSMGLVTIVKKEAA